LNESIPGWVAYTFYCAFLVLFNFDNYKDAIDTIICLGPEERESTFIYDKTLSKYKYAKVKNKYICSLKNILMEN